MTLTIPRAALILAILAGLWWIARRPGPESEGSPSTAGLDRAMRARLELAVVSAENAAQCGYGEAGYSYQPPEEAARHLVALMRSASGTATPAPDAGGPTVSYVVGRPERAWQVGVRLDSAGPTLLIEGFGPDLTTPLVTRRVPCS